MAVDILDVSEKTLAMVKVYAPKMGITLPLDDESIHKIYKNFYGQEVSYAMEAEEIKNKGREWEQTENISNMFANAADELADFANRDNPDYKLLSQRINEIVLDPSDDWPEYHQWYTKEGTPTDF